MKQSISKRFAFLPGAIKATIPVMAGYIFLGTAYGITMRESGFGTMWTLLVSLLVYAGSMQFALVGLLCAAFSPVTTVLMTLMVNARHLFYGLSMLQPYRHTGKAKPYLIFSLTDETYSLVANGAPTNADSTCWFLTVSALNQFYWVLGSVLGAVLGQVIPFDMTGIDFAMTALFTVIVTEQAVNAYQAWKAGKQPFVEAFGPALLGAGATMVCLVTVGKQAFLIAAMVMMLICFYVMFRREERKGANE
ncbi:MAG: AzlC family ABC transporter permease [Clostridia bacterium]|nr:AzlC family ABC transporter permease [Clostridia bacterium]